MLRMLGSCSLAALTIQDPKVEILLTPTRTHLLLMTNVPECGLPTTCRRQRTKFLPPWPGTSHWHLLDSGTNCFWKVSSQAALSEEILRRLWYRSPFHFSPKASSYQFSVDHLDYRNYGNLVQNLTLFPAISTTSCDHTNAFYYH